MDGFHTQQWTRKPKVTHTADDVNEYGFCRQHDPVARRQRDREKVGAEKEKAMKDMKEQMEQEAKDNPQPDESEAEE